MSTTDTTTEPATREASDDTETCSCGRPAKVAYETDNGAVPYCGIPSVIHAGEADQRPTYPFTVEQSERAHLGLIQEAATSVEEATGAAKALALRLVEDLYWTPEPDEYEVVEKLRYAATLLYCLSNVGSLDAMHVQASYATERARRAEQAAQAEEVDA